MMVNPISNDKLSTQIPERSQIADSDRANRKNSGSEAASAPEKAPVQEVPDDSADVSRTGAILSSPPSDNSAVVIDTPDQAIALAEKVREDIESAGFRALEVYGNVSAEQATGLLSQAPL